MFGLPPGRDLATPPLGQNSGSDLGAHEGFHKPGNIDGWRHDRFPFSGPAAIGNKALDPDRDGEECASILTAAEELIVLSPNENWISCNIGRGRAGSGGLR